jgi:hypothetical protein
MQEKVDALEIIRGFPKLVRQYCTFTPEEYEKKNAKFGIKRGYYEIYISILLMDQREKNYDKFYGAINISGQIENVTLEQDSIMRNYRMNEREAMFENGDVIKYVEKENINGFRQLEPEWIFSPMLGWDQMPEEVIEQINNSNCMWDYFGKVIYDESYADPKAGWRKQFFIMKSSGEWKFRIVPNLFIFEGY